MFDDEALLAVADDPVRLAWLMENPDEVDMAIDYGMEYWTAIERTTVYAFFRLNYQIDAFKTAVLETLSKGFKR